MSLTAIDLTDDAAILPVLALDRRWAAYALCDLEPPYRPFARYIGLPPEVRAGRREQASGLVLVYAPPDFTSLLPCGDRGAVRDVLSAARDLPAAPFLIVRHADLLAVEMRYHVVRAWTMLRLVVAADELRPAPRVAARIDPLAPADLPALRALYAHWPDTVFTPFMFAHGVYYGAYVDDRLVAVAGTHACAPRHGAGVIGNVFTHPRYRGRGFAAATTGAVTQALVSMGVREVALNVREDNTPAIRAYTRLGFALYQPFLEGHATLR